jgi:hypothetical protein
MAKVIKHKVGLVREQFMSELNKKIETEKPTSPTPPASEPQFLTADVVRAQIEELYPTKIPESQGDLADRADIEIEQGIQEMVWRIRKQLNRTV